MPSAVHVHLQLRIVGDDGTVFTDCEILRLEKSGSKPLACRSARANPCRSACSSRSSPPRLRQPAPLLSSRQLCRRLILGFGVLAEECAGCDHRTHVRWQIMAFFDGVWLLQWPASPISRY